jgi:hypothetical protein
MSFQDTDISQNESVDHHAIYCAGCETNWSQLPTMDEEQGDEWYVFCPTCRTDSFLEDGKEGPTFSFNSITGEMIDDVTGIPVYIPISDPPPVPVNFGVFDEAEFISNKNRADKAEEMAIQSYQDTLPQGEQAAQAAYRNALRKNYINS